MAERAQPPDGITPRDFFTRWVPAAVAEDESRRHRLGDTDASLLFVLGEKDEGAECFTLQIAKGAVSGREGRTDAPDLTIHVDVPTWRALNRGEISAPEALLRRRLRISGNFVLALKLHLILG